MGSIKSLAVTLCISFIAVGFISRLVPKARLSKNLKNIFGLIFIIVIISPFFKGIQIDFDKYKDTYDSADISEYESNIAKSTVKYLTEVISKRLELENIEVSYLKIESEQTENGTEIKGAVIKTNNNSLAKKIIEGEYNINVIG